MPIQLQELLIEPGAEKQSVKCALFAQVISRHGVAKLKAWGTSMVPAILPGDTLIVQRQQIADLAVGDVAVYLRSGRVFAHRVTRVVNEPVVALITRGDAMHADDPPVSAAQILGRVASIVPRPRIAARIRRSLRAWKNALVTVFLPQS